MTRSMLGFGASGPRFAAKPVVAVVSARVFLNVMKTFDDTTSTIAIAPIPLFRAERAPT